jgi:hypothetical protein
MGKEELIAEILRILEIATERELKMVLQYIKVIEK